MCTLVFCKDLSYINNIDLPWEDLVFLSFHLHTASVQRFQNKPAISFDSSPPLNFLFFQHVRNSHIQPPEARSLAMLEVLAFLRGSRGADGVGYNQMRKGAAGYGELDYFY